MQVCRAEEAAAAAAVVVNYEEGGVLHTMAVPKRYRQPGGATTAEMPRVGIPAIMISREGGAVLRRAMRKPSVQLFRRYGYFEGEFPLPVRSLE